MIFNAPIGSGGRSTQTTINDRGKRHCESVCQRARDSAIFGSLGRLYPVVTSRTPSHQVGGHHVICTYTHTINTPPLELFHTPVIGLTITHLVIPFHRTPANAVIAVDFESGLLAINCTSTSGMHHPHSISPPLNTNPHLHPYLFHLRNDPCS